MVENNETEKAKRVSVGISFTQLLALILGVGGMFADYRYDIYGDEHLPVIVYTMLIGVGFGLDKIQNIVSAAKKTSGESSS
jgi:hypothetical protein